MMSTQTVDFDAYATKLSSNDARLLRRLDFRFLLPNSTLGHLAYSGETCGALYSALTRFCDSVHQLDSCPPGDRFPLVILRLPRAKDFEKIADRVQPGGCIYAEIERPFQSDWTGDLSSVPWNLRPLSNYLVQLRRMGFDEIDAFWHRPHFDRCIEMVPLTSKPALRFVLNRNTGGIKRQLKVSLGKVVLRSGLLSQLIPCFSLVAVRHAG